MLISVLGISAAAASTPERINGVFIQFGDPDYPATEPESLMSLTRVGTSSTYNAVYGGTSDYYPNILTLCAYAPANDASSTVSLTAVSDTVRFMTYDASGEHEHSTIDYAANQNLNSSGQLVNSNVFTVKLTGAGDVTVSNNGVAAFTIHFSAPASNPAASGAAPAYVNGYLPLGQYASGASWGSVFTNYTNAAGVSAGDAVTKITSGYAAMGLSLGAPGGYIQFEFAGSGVENDPTNPYGIDFVVYGNPFVGNPEAASVMVSNDGVNWYELAGSRYYAEETMHNATLTYTLKSDGVYYSLNNGPQTLFKSATAWWPADSEGYAAVDGVGDLFQGNKTVNNVVRGTDAAGNPTITFQGLTLVKDSDTTNDYLFGYADVRNVGSTKDGTACNPYETAPGSGTASMLGGDGFDLSWAVDGNGNPVKLDYAKYVRIYTSAALDPKDLDDLPTPSIFGETSAEICGVFVAKGTGSGSAVVPTITIDGENPASLAEYGVTMETERISDNQQIVTISGLEEGYDTAFTLGASGGTYVYMNGTATNSVGISLESGEMVVQIINQSGTAAPFITLVKLQA